ncbi:MAG: alpha/beta hydrolase [Clostridiales bacterium]|nr:alpha/beta hydrolase [Clostridiales bacterium]
MTVKPKIQEYVIRDGKTHPFAVICPGGGYAFVSKRNEGVPYAKLLNAKGISAFVVSYRVGKNARFPAPIDDLAAAVTDILARADELHLDKDNYSVWGSSAGGHLAACFCTESVGYKKYRLPKPRAVVLTYPVITMGDLTHEGSKLILLGENPDEKLVELTSVEKQVTANYPPCFIWCGNADDIVPSDNSAMMSEALEANGVAHEFVLYDGVRHGVGLGKGLPCEGWADKAVDFWLRQK